MFPGGVTLWEEMAGFAEKAYLMLGASLINCRRSEPGKGTWRRGMEV